MTRLRLGLPITNGHLPRICPLCRTETSGTARHAFTCTHGDIASRKTDRHNVLRDTIIRALQRWGMIVQREPKIEHFSSERADLEIIQHQGTITIDVSVTEPSVVSHQQNQRHTAATLIRERHKQNKYVPMCRDTDKHFIPFALKTFDGLGDKALELFNELSNRPSCLRILNPQRFIQDLRQPLSCLLMRRNTHILHRWCQLVLPQSQGGVRRD